MGKWLRPLPECCGTAWGASLVVLAVYLASLSPSFGFVDKGEMVAVAATLGIAHPTGYPTILLLGYLFTRLVPLREVVALNLMAALLGAASAGALTLCFSDVLRRLQEADAGADDRCRRKAKGGEGPGQRVHRLSPGALRCLAGAGAVFTALTATWWSQANGFEVYSLHLLMIPLLTWLFLRYVDEQEREPKASSSRRGAGFALTLGVSFTNHMSTILLAPAFITHFFSTLGVHRRSFRRVLWLAPTFLLGLLPYLWLPFRASMKPRFNWGDPSTWDRFLAHVTGRQYRVWMFTNPESFHQQTTYFFGNLPREVAFVGLLLALTGIFELARREWPLALWSLLLASFCPVYLWAFAGDYGLLPCIAVIVAAWGLGLRWTVKRNTPHGRLSLFATLLFVATVVYASGYDIMEIRPYYLTAVFVVGLWATMGLYGLGRRMGNAVALAAALLLVGLTGIANFYECYERHDTLVEDMTRDVLCNLPADAIVLSAQWDFWVSGSWYLQAVEGLRTDVVVIDPELLRRSWYLDQLSRAYPGIMKRVKREEARFRSELYKFEHGAPYEPAVIDGAYRALINAIIDRHIGERPVFVTTEVEHRFGARYVRVPFYLAFRLMKDGSYLRQGFPRYRYRPGRRPVSVYTSKQAELYAASAYARAVYEARNGHQELAGQYLDLAFSFEPTLRPEDVPPQPLDGNQRVAATLRWFGALGRLRREGLR